MTTAKITRPQVIGEVELHREVDFGACLDGWTLEEIEKYVGGDDDEGAEILASDSYVIDEDVWSLDVPKKALAEYVAWRKANGHEGRLT